MSRLEFLHILSPWGFLLSLAIIIAVASTFSLWRSKWHVLDVSEGRLGALDGLRGLLSYAVFIHHGIISYFYLHFATWIDPPSPFYKLLGNVPVAVFFQLTAFLFWRKVLDASAPIDYRRMLAGRAWRLTPAYLFAVALTLLLIAASTDWKVQVPVMQLMHELTRWLSFGFVYPWPVPTNNMANAVIVNSVFWTLAYEWRFYFVLPLFAVFRRDLLFPLVLFMVLFMWPDIAGQHVPVNFGMGMIAARASRAIPRQQTGLAKLGLDIIAATALYLLMTTQPHGYDWQATFLVAIVLHAVVFGSTLFGLLDLRGVRLLGVTSYSFYLLHSPVLFLCLWPLRKQVASDAISPPAYFLLLTVIGVVVLLVSMLSYKYTEEPFLRHPVRPLTRRPGVDERGTRTSERPAEPARLPQS